MGETRQLSITFKPNPVQKSFIESRAEADLFASRMGEGKSAALAWALYYYTVHNPGAEIALIRDTWLNLQATSMKEFFKWFPSGIMGNYHATKKEFIWAEGVARGTVCFLGLDDPDDASKLQSREFGGFCMDEPAPAAESGGISEFVFDIAKGRNRQPGMRWYMAKLATNNPDETHWTYRQFEIPGTAPSAPDELPAEQTPGYAVWRSGSPENVANLPTGYYARLRKQWSHRPDLVRRFVDGDYGFQRAGKSVTPEWNDRLHLSHGLYPIPRVPLHMLWDFGGNPTCLITQVTPTRRWLFLESMVGEEMGIEELCETWVVPVLKERYTEWASTRGVGWSHIGDPAGMMREQSSHKSTAVKMIQRRLGGRWQSGPIKIEERLDPLKAALRQTVEGSGMIQVDRHRASHVWQSLRGGWHYRVSKAGVVSGEPIKNMHSHPGDATGYGAAVLFPLGKLKKTIPERDNQQQAGYFRFGSNSSTPRGGQSGSLDLGRAKGAPAHGSSIGANALNSGRIGGG